MLAEARIVVRRPDGQDGEPVARFLAGLPLASRYHRFFSGIRHLPRDLVETMIAATAGQAVLLALDGDTVVGHAMATCEADGVVDIGIVVAAGYQYRGIGARLMHELAAALVARGLTRIRCDVLSENAVVLDWLRRSLQDTHFERDCETTTVHGTLTGTRIGGAL